jgi:polyhydroxybutyrate depolymerase
MQHRRSLVVCLLALPGLVVGCTSSDSTASSRSVPATTTTTTTTLPDSKPSAGCARIDGRVRPPRGDTTQQVTTAGVTHPYLLSVPASYRATRPAPLVLLFAGFGSDARSMAALTKLPALGATRGVIVATPNGPNGTWQLSGTGSDATFVDDIVTKLSNALCIDLHRVYATGFSQGAAFTIFYACARPGRIAAIATVAVDFQLGCTKPIPIVAFHGTVDPAVPYRDGALGTSLPGVKVRGTLLNMSDWARLDRCASTPTTRSVGAEVTLKTWPRCTDGTAVALYTIENGSHTWPGANPAASPLYTTQQINATKLILGFFARHPLAATSSR